LLLLCTSPLKAFQLQILSFDADSRGLRNTCFPWYFMDCAVSSGWSSWHRTISFTWSLFLSVRVLRGLSLPWRLSTVFLSLNFFSNLLMLLVIHPLSGNSVRNCVTFCLQCFHAVGWAAGMASSLWKHSASLCIHSTDINFFNALSLLVAWQEDIWPHKNSLCHLVPNILFQNKWWKRTEGEANPGLPEKWPLERLHISCAVWNGFWLWASLLWCVSD